MILDCIFYLERIFLRLLVKFEWNLRLYGSNVLIWIFWMVVLWLCKRMFLFYVKVFSVDRVLYWFFIFIWFGEMLFIWIIISIFISFGLF